MNDFWYGAHYVIQHHPIKTLRSKSPFNVNKYNSFHVNWAVSHYPCCKPGPEPGPQLLLDSAEALQKAQMAKCRLNETGTSISQREFVHLRV